MERYLASCTMARTSARKCARSRRSSRRARGPRSSLLPRSRLGRGGSAPWCAPHMGERLFGALALQQRARSAIDHRDLLVGPPRRDLEVIAPLPQLARVGRVARGDVVEVNVAARPPLSRSRTTDRLAALGAREEAVGARDSPSSPVRRRGIETLVAGRAAAARREVGIRRAGIVAAGRPSEGDSKG